MEEDFYSKRYDIIQQNLLKEDGLMDADGNINQAPHCDPLVLHEPGTCVFCDKYPDRQNARINRRVAFTGEHHPLSVIFINPSPEQKVVISYDPNVHDLSSEHNEGKVIAAIQPKAVKDDNYLAEKPLVRFIVNEVEHTKFGTQISYEDVLYLFKEDRGEHEYRHAQYLYVRYKTENEKGVLRPGQVITIKPRMEFKVTVMKTNE